MKELDTSRTVLSPLFKERIQTLHKTKLEVNKEKLAKYGGAGTLVPITGFANAVCSPALEFRTEGVITGTGVKIFTIAGPVIVCGVGASWVYGLVYWVSTFF